MSADCGEDQLQFEGFTFACPLTDRKSGPSPPFAPVTQVL